jgi:hypothetical protein
LQSAQSEPIRKSIRKLGVPEEERGDQDGKLTAVGEELVASVPVVAV